MTGSGHMMVIEQRRKKHRIRGHIQAPAFPCSTYVVPPTTATPNLMLSRQEAQRGDDFALFGKDSIKQQVVDRLWHVCEVPCSEAMVTCSV